MRLIQTTALIAGRLVVLAGLANPLSARGAIAIDLSVSADPYSPSGWYSVGETISVSVFLRQTDASEEIPIHGLFLDFYDTSYALSLGFPLTDPTNGIFFWELGGSCGVSCYAVDDELDDLQLLSINWLPDPFSSNPPPLILPADGSGLHIGSLYISGVQHGTHILDLVNQSEPEVGPGTLLYSWPLGAETPTIWRATEGEIIGGEAIFNIGIPEPTTFLILLSGLIYVASSKRIPCRVRSVSLSVGIYNKH